jgi:hypothetical protein
VVGLHRVWTDTTYHVRGAYKWDGGGVPDRTEVNAIGSRLDDLLHNHEELTTTIHVHSFREEPEPMPVFIDNDGKLWLQSGGVFRVRASAV